ncbi:hypothetical protein [Patulibacter minatonensis]|uniref:hypothetical protein n=1 Tax=Patulibacter minatonensis TaxID=298163 RepID=UPI00047E8DF3|nr:hypothetical protein [Patulibacter minatonensis]
MTTTLRTTATRRTALLSTIAAGGVTAALVLLPAASSEAVPPGGAVSRSNGASVTLSTTSVKRGGRIKVTGRNWKAQGSRTGNGKVVTIKLDDRDILAQIPIRNKRFSGYVTIPRPVAKGRHTLRFLASKPATSIKSKSFKVR